MPTATTTTTTVKTSSTRTSAPKTTPKKVYPPGVHKNPQTTIRLSEKVRKMLHTIAEFTDKTQTDVVSCAIEHLYAVYCQKQNVVTKVFSVRKTHPKKTRKKSA